MLQLSFVYEDESELQSKFMTPNLGIKELIQLALLRERFNTDQINNIKLLTSRLNPVIIKPVIITTETVPIHEKDKTFIFSPGSGVTHHQKKSHVMISYCWNKVLLLLLLLLFIIYY